MRRKDVDLCGAPLKFVQGMWSFFGKPPQGEGSHQVYKTPWQRNHRITIQNHKRKFKAYQVKQEFINDSL